MVDFESELSDVLRYCGADYERAAEELSRRASSFSDIAGMDSFVIEKSLGKKYAEMIRVISAIASRRITDGFKLGKAHTEEEIFEFLRGYYLDIANETVIIMPLDSQGRIISADLVVEGTVNFSAVLPRKILEIMLMRNSKSAILAHNHPSGKANPSAEDIETTRIISELLIASNKRLVCHYIVAGNDIYKLDSDNA